VSTSPPGCSQRQWYHTDVTGTPLARSDAGSVVARLDFLPWGEPWTSGTSGAVGDRKFNGRVSDPGTGFTDYGARVYFPLIGRFISPDGTPGDPSNPNSFNRYAYALNGPLAYTEPDGHLPFLVVTAGLGEAGGAIWGAYTSYMENGKVDWSRVGHYAVIGTVAGFTLGGAAAAGLTGAAVAETAVVGKAAVLAGYGGYVWAAGVASEIAYTELTGLSPQPGTVVLGQYRTRIVSASGEEVGILETKPNLAAEAAKLGGKLLDDLPKDINAIKPHLDAAKRIVFFVGQKMSGLTGEELKYILSKPELIKKTIFVREAPWTMPLPPVPPK